MPEPTPNWLSTNQIFLRHPCLHPLLHSPSLRTLSTLLAHSIISGLFRNRFVASRILLKALSLSPSFAYSIFTQIPNPNSFSYNTIISHFPSMYNVMLRNGVAPDAHTFPSLISSLSADSGFLRNAHAHVFVTGFGSQVFAQTALVSAYFDCGLGDDAVKVFDGMSKKDVVTWTAMISGLSDLGFHMRAVQVFNTMREESSVTPNIATVVSVMSACAGLGSLELTRCLHSYVDKTGLILHIFVKNSLVDTYAKCGSVACACKVFDQTLDKDKFSWTGMITAFASHGLGNDAVNVFKTMQRSGIVPDTTAFIAVLSACSHAGLVKEGVEIFNSMITTYGTSPDLKHYGCMVDLYSRAGLLHDAYKLLMSMPMEPNLAILGALLSACRLHDNLELAELVAKRIESTCEYQGGARVLMSNMYANSKKWHDVVSVRKSIRREESMPQGRSWVDVKINQ